MAMSDSRTIRVFAAEFTCPNGTNTCKACCVSNAVCRAVRPVSKCSNECEGNYYEFATLAEAMAGYPDLPWHDLPVGMGDTPEPELVAAVQAHLATITIGPP